VQFGILTKNDFHFKFLVMSPLLKGFADFRWMQFDSDHQKNTNNIQLKFTLSLKGISCILYSFFNDLKVI